MTKFLDATLVDAMLEVIGKGSIFTVIFEKQDGSVRKMLCQRGVTKHLKGGVSTIKDHENLVGVYENQKDYRCFDKRRVMEIHGGAMTLVRKQ